MFEAVKKDLQNLYKITRKASLAKNKERLIIAYVCRLLLCSDFFLLFVGQNYFAGFNK